MKCPYCLTSIHESWFNHPNQMYYGNEVYLLTHMSCPHCSNIIIRLGTQKDRSIGFIYELVKPKVISRNPLSHDVPEGLRNDYNEACLVLADSPKASAALSRRCLQNILREKAGVKQGDLSVEIQEVLDTGKLPAHIAEDLDAVRNIGNFAAHPIKSKSSGEIVDVEPGEAEWNLDVLESLFEFYFVQPAISKTKRELLNQKLIDAGKPPMKEPKN